MSQVSKFRRAAAIVLSGALLATAVPPAQALPMPVVARELANTSAVEEVQYRRVAKRRAIRRGNQAAGAAAIIGALAIGAAALAASQNSRRSRHYYEDDGYYAQPGYAYPQTHYYQPQPQYYQAPPRQRYRAQPQVDSGSPYIVHQQRVAQPRVVDPYAPRQDWRGRYRDPRTGGTLPPGVLPPPTGPYQQAVTIPSNN